MDKARAMLDALMGPGRDETNTKGPKTEKFKDGSVCKSFLLGWCPLDPLVLGGKRRMAPCSKIHSALMKEQFEAHPDVDKLRLEYQVVALRDLEYIVRECDSHIASERNRIRQDTGRKKPPLPAVINDTLSIMKKQSAAMIARAESLDDDQLREKEVLVKKAAEINQDREELLELETKKAIEALKPEEVCEICGTSYMGEDGRAMHNKFKIHEGHEKVRRKLAELRRSTADWESKKRDMKEQEYKQKRKDDWEAAQARDARKKDRGKDKGDRGRKEKGVDSETEKEGCRKRSSSGSRKPSPSRSERGGRKRVRQRSSSRSEREKDRGRDRRTSRRKDERSRSRRRSISKRRRSRSRSRRAGHRGARGRSRS